MRFKQGWLLVAGLCLLAAAAFWWRGLADATFVAAALGVTAWFLNVRAQLRRKYPVEEEIEEEAEEAMEEETEEERGR